MVEVALTLMEWACGEGVASVREHRWHTVPNVIGIRSRTLRHLHVRVPTTLPRYHLR
jgi:hypothetical protein